MARCLGRRRHLPAPEYRHLSPPTFAGDTWTYVDLEIDLFSDMPGVVRVDDEDEFDAARRAGIISEDEARAARAATDEIAELVRSTSEPFSQEGPQRLAQARAAGLPPLRRLPPTTALDR